jgi:primary-amine oxidase
MGEETKNPHPLDPCSAEELTSAVALLRDTDKLSERAFFSCGFPAEPPKDLVSGFKPGTPFDRVVRLIGHDRTQGQSFEANVSLSRGVVESFGWVEDGQAPIGAADFFEMYRTLTQNEDWIAALEKRGIEDRSLVHLEPWVAGVHPPEMSRGRVFRVIAFLHLHPDDNYYARPIEGLVALIDVDSGKVIVEDHGVVPIPTESGEYAAARVGELRDDLKPLEITQPDGPSFEVDGHVITWQKWRIRISVHPIEGLVLHDVRYQDGERDRPILYRASLSDMVVPYGDPSPMHFWKHAFDAGETALGHQANSLKLGCDCLGDITYFDAVLLGPDGEPALRENAVCLHEEDYGVLWKHTNVFRPDLSPEVRRSRRLVVSMIHTVGNYEYGFFWYFYLDGTIQMEVKLTGIIGVSAVADGVGSDSAPLVAPSIASPIHQHLFCFRMDFQVDGTSNSVVESDVEPIPAGSHPRSHPYGAGFRSVSRTLRTEREAMRDIDPARSRNWRIINPESRNALGTPVGYKLLPQASPTLLAPDDSTPGKRAGFARHNLWVTPYAPDEHYAGAGPFSNLHPGGAGLPAYTAGDRPIDDTDIVIWHTFGVTHVPRPEDWPVMPVEYAGFMLMPVGFFDHNPSIDVPPSKTCAS